MSSLNEKANVGCFMCGDLSERGGYIRNRADIVLAVDMAPIAPVHYLAFPRPHIVGYANVPNAYHEELKTQAHAFQAACASWGLDALFAEHGNSGPRHVEQGSCFDHAHVHFLGLSKPNAVEAPLLDRAVAAAMAGLSIGESGVTDLAGVQQLRGKNYFWFSHDLAELRWFEVQAPVRQFVRKVVAQLQGSSVYESHDLWKPESASARTEAARQVL